MTNTTSIMGILNVNGLVSSWGAGFMTQVQALAWWQILAAVILVVALIFILVKMFEFGLKAVLYAIAAALLGFMVKLVLGLKT